MAFAAKCNEPIEPARRAVKSNGTPLDPAASEKIFEFLAYERRHRTVGLIGPREKFRPVLLDGLIEHSFLGVTTTVDEGLTGAL